MIQQNVGKSSAYPRQRTPGRLGPAHTDSDDGLQISDLRNDVFGRELRLPSDLLFGCPKIEDTEVNDYAEDLRTGKAPTRL